MKAHFDAEQKLELLDFMTTNHEEFIPLRQVLASARPWHEWQKEWQKLNDPHDGKQSPEMNKKKMKVLKSPQQPPPDFEISESRVKSNMGITPAVFQFLEVRSALPIQAVEANSS